MVTLARIDVRPDDGPVGPKHVGVINFSVLLSVKVLKCKKFSNKKTLVLNFNFVFPCITV